MEIHLIRHTEVENPERVCYGFAEIPLRQNYHEDFKSISLEKNYDKIISSPSQRCQLLARYFELNYQTEERLREMNFGDWEMKRWTEIPSEEIDPWYLDFVNIPAKNGESLLEMQKRVLSFWNELLNEKDLSTVLIVSHAGVIRLILQSILQFPLENMFSIQVDYGKKTVIEVNNGLILIKHINN